MRKFLSGVALLLVLISAGAAFAGVVKLKNGDEITGRIVERTDSHIKLKTEYGPMEIPLERVESVLDQVRVHLKNESVITGEIVARTDKEMKLETPLAEKPIAIPTKDIVKIEPVEEKKTEKKEEPEKKPAPAADAETLQRRAIEHLHKKEYDKSIEAYRKYLELEPGDEIALYNLACAYSLAGKKAEAVECLRKAIEAGYTNFDHIQRDTDLDNIRGEEGYKKLFEDKDKLIGAAAEGIIERYKKKLGDEYNYIKDEKYKLVVISNVDKQRLDGLVGALQAYADCHWKDFFKNKPKYYITVLIPNSTEEYRRKFGGRQGAAGFYNPGTRILTVNLATGGGTMIHEFTHALHYADMEGLSQRHPIWIIEGFGSLYEQCTRREGSGYGMLNWRLPGLKQAIAGDKCYNLKKFIGNSGSYFSQNAGLSYAISRYIFYFLQEKKMLRKWYAKYRENYEKDKTGLKMLEEVYGKSIDEFEKDWLAFLKPLNYGRSGIADDRPFIGVGLEDSDTGLKVTNVVGGSPAEKGGLKSGDIILKMGNKDIKDRSDLQKVIGKHKIGDEVKFVVKRDGEEKEVTVKLGKRQ